ncbi:MAG: protein-glutamate O-methyltransferase CheR [Clostridiales Family XIII bacterium]|jgi:chemotaxis protein methyltransferase CheR|nr:protein-glutamate O-methyltransferase CheR [Clostridiales Family XIII bacterium]
MIAMTDSEFLEISGYIRKHYGVNLERKRPLIEGRLGFYIDSSGYASYKDYFEYMKNDPTHRELANFLNRLTTNHTFFLREEEHFDFYGRTVLPWIEHELNDRDLRVWSAGCSTGQEPYTLAIVTQNYIGARASEWDSVILASDISDKALTTARDGIYPAEELASVPDEWRRKYFTMHDRYSFKVTPDLRNKVAFKNFNLIEPFSVKKPFHAIFCKNVMIYFDSDTKSALVNKFYDALCDGGYFFIGHSESLSMLEHRFQYVNPSIYRKE